MLQAECVSSERTALPQAHKMKAKVCVIGEGGVGKTSLIQRFATNQFEDKYLKTVGTKVTKVALLVPYSPDVEVDVDLVLFDIMGQKGFRDMIKDTFFVGAQGIIAVCDLTSRESLVAVPDWVAVAMEITGAVPVLVLANKADLAKDAKLSEAELRACAQSLGASLVCTSAKEKTGVEDAFNLVAVEIVNVAMKALSVSERDQDLYVNILSALEQRASVGLNKRELLDIFKGVAYPTLEDEILRLERDALIQLNWLGRDDFRAYLTPLGREALLARRPAGRADLPQAIL